MKASLLFTLAAVATASPLAAQSALVSLSGDSVGEFRDLGIVELVDATNALLDPAPAPRSKRARLEAPDASLCSPDSLLFCEQDPLAPGETPCPTTFHGTMESSEPPTSAAPVTGPSCPESSARRLIPCSESGSRDGSVVSASLPVLAGATPVPADQVPEPSAILLVVGAAAWILLRRKY